jgi:hypothetical protein
VEEKELIYLLVIATLAVNFFRPVGGIAGFEFYFAFSFVAMVLFVAHALPFP